MPSPTPSATPPALTPDLLSALADLLDPADDAFQLLGYEPTCVPRVTAAKALGFHNPVDAVHAGQEHRLPAACGGCPQELFHQATEFDVLYGGAAGGGKSAALVAEALRACHRHPGLRVGAFRRTNPELEESLIAELARLDFGRALGARWNASKYNLRFPNNSVIMFRYAENLQDATRRQGGQYQLLIFDERTLTPPDVVDFLSHRLRSGRADIPVLGIRSGTNPGGIGHAAVRARYIEATRHGAQVVTDIRGRSIRFIQARLTDNPHLNPEYADDLNQLPEAMRKAFRDGDWDVFAGQVFTEWRRDRHVTAPFRIPPDWRRLGGIDYGYRAPSAVLWAALDPDGRAWVYRELYKPGLGEQGLADRITAASLPEDRHCRFAADPAMWNKTGDADAPADVLIRSGLHLDKADNERVIGWQRIHSYLAEAPACAHHRKLGWDICPLLHVFEPCVDLIRTLPALPYAGKGNPEDADTEGEDHLPDALRYLLMAAGTGAGYVLGDDHPTAEGGQELLNPLGEFAHRPDPSLPDFTDDSPDAGLRGRTRRSPYAPPET